MERRDRGLKPAPAPMSAKDAYADGYNAGARAALAAQGLRIVGQRVNVTDTTHSGFPGTLPELRGPAAS